MGLPPSAARVQAALGAAGSEAIVLETPSSTRTAAEAARSVGAEVGQIVKSLVFLADGEPVLLLVAGDRRVDLRKAAVLAEARTLVRPDAAVVREVTGYAIGGVPPLGHDRALPAFMDESLRRFEVVWAAGGTPSAVFATSPEELESLTRAVVGDLTEGEGS